MQYVWQFSWICRVVIVNGNERLSIFHMPSLYLITVMIICRQSYVKKNSHRSCYFTHTSYTYSNVLLKHSHLFWKFKIYVYSTCIYNTTELYTLQTGHKKKYLEIFNEVTSFTLFTIFIDSIQPWNEFFKSSWSLLSLRNTLAIIGL